MVDHEEPFRVPNIGNTCYISSLLVGLFYTPSANDYLLNTDIRNVNGIYLQEIINNHFVRRIREHKSVSIDTMEQIRLYCSELGWKKETPEELYRQQDVNEFYMFLLETLNGVQIKIQSETITEAITSPDDIGKETDIPYIPLALPIDPSIKSIKLKDMLDKWLSDDVKEVKRKIRNDYGLIEEKTVSALDIKHITNLPPIIPVGINRFQNIKDESGAFKLIRNNTDVYIQTKISPFKNVNNYVNRDHWDFCAAICHRGDTPNAGHYYCLVRDSNNCFFIFDDLRIPCLQYVEMNDHTVTKMLKLDCVFVIYKQKV